MAIAAATSVASLIVLSRDFVGASMPPVQTPVRAKASPDRAAALASPRAAWRMAATGGGHDGENPDRGRPDRPHHRARRALAADQQHVSDRRSRAGEAAPRRDG